MCVCVRVCMCVCVYVCPANVLGDTEEVPCLVHQLEPGLVEPLYAGRQVRVLVPHLRSPKVQLCV